MIHCLASSLEASRYQVLLQAKPQKLASFGFWSFEFPPTDGLLYWDTCKPPAQKLERQTAHLKLQT